MCVLEYQVEQGIVWGRRHACVPAPGESKGGVELLYAGLETWFAPTPRVLEAKD